jgi:hypothetical protein
MFCGKSWYLFCPYEKHLLTEKYYTSDYDLSKFDSQYGLGFTYTDIFYSLKSCFRIKINRFTIESLHKK